MKVARLLSALRFGLDDVATPQLWPDLELGGYLDEGLVKLCADTKILKDQATVGEVLSSAVVTLTGTAGQVDSVKVDDITITSGAVSFNSDLPTTATDLAANINAFMATPGYIATGNPIYTADATAGDGSLSITAVAGTGVNPNDYVVQTTTSGGDLAAADTTMSGGTSLCEMYLVPDRSEYPVDPRVFFIERIKPADRAALGRATIDWMDSNRPRWESDNPGTPKAFIPDASPGTVTFWPTPDTAETVKVRVCRGPLSPIIASDGSTVNTDLDIELSDFHMEGVKYWAKRCAYLKKDAETFRPENAGDFEKRYYAFVEDVKRKILFSEAM